MAKTDVIPQREWSLMFYFASDNPLAPSIVSQLKAIKQAGFHPQANVVVHFDPNADMSTKQLRGNQLSRREGFWPFDPRDPLDPEGPLPPGNQCAVN